jgi:hypothetical protein
MNHFNYTRTNLEGGNHDIQLQSTNSAINSYNYLYPTGKINPIERQVVKKIICVDSLFRSNYKSTSASNFIWELPVPQQSVIEMKIVAAELPNFWYAFSNSKRNNIFSIQLFNIVGQSDTEVMVTIPEGNYSSDDITSIMNNLFLSTGQGLQYLLFEVNTYNAKSVIRSRNINDNPSESLYNPSYQNYSPDFYFTINFNVDGKVIQNSQDNSYLFQTAGWMLGFRNPTYTVTNTVNYQYVDNISTPNSILYNYYLTSESAYGSSINDYVFIAIDDFNKNFVTDAISSTLKMNSYIGNNILGRITINTNSYSVNETYAADCIFKTRQYLGPIFLQKFQVSLIDKFGNFLELNDTNFSFALELTILY